MHAAIVVKIVGEAVAAVGVVGLIVALVDKLKQAEIDKQLKRDRWRKKLLEGLRLQMQFFTSESAIATTRAESARCQFRIASEAVASTAVKKEAAWQQLLQQDDIEATEVAVKYAAKAAAEAASEVEAAKVAVFSIKEEMGRKSLPWQRQRLRLAKATAEEALTRYQNLRLANDTKEEAKQQYLIASKAAKAAESEEAAAERRLATAEEAARAAAKFAASDEVEVARWMRHFATSALKAAEADVAAAVAAGKDEQEIAPLKSFLKRRWQEVYEADVLERVAAASVVAKNLQRT